MNGYWALANHSVWHLDFVFEVDGRAEIVRTPRDKVESLQPGRIGGRDTNQQWFWMLINGSRLFIPF